jgi:Secretion system C-terminal sorting domain
LPETDTLLIGNCNETIERLHSNYDLSCFEPSTWYSDLYEGLGGPYYYSYDPTLPGNNWFSKTLTYYNTSQHSECGTLVSFVGLKEIVEIKVNVFPNPASDKLIVKTPFEQCHYKIISENGSLIKNGVNQEHEFEIDISLLQKGTYSIEIDGSNGYLIKKSFIKA